jgi:hypothetical protein
MENLLIIEVAISDDNFIKNLKEDLKYQKVKKFYTRY